MANERRLIDVNALIAYFGEQYNLAMDDPDPVSGYVMSALRCCIEHFKTIHTVDAVEVVRCKDCKHNEHYDALLYCGHTRGLAGSVAPDSFCSYGERRTDA